jgi:hypothetical protein
LSTGVAFQPLKNGTATMSRTTTTTDTAAMAFPFGTILGTRIGLMRAW